MAKVVIEFDTKGKGVSVTFDGKALDNVVSAEVYRRDYGYSEGGDDGDVKFAFCVSQAERDKDNDTSKLTRIVAARSALGRRADATAVPSLPELRAVPASGQDDKAVRDIVDFFSD